MKAVRLIVDGSALGNPGSGGWACILQYQASERVLTGSEPESTNNKMEMVAALRGLQALKEPCQVEVITDSEYLQRRDDPVSQPVEGQWVAHPFRTPSGQP